MKYAMELVSYS